MAAKKYAADEKTLYPGHFPVNTAGLLQGGLSCRTGAPHFSIVYIKPHFMDIFDHTLSF